MPAGAKPGLEKADWLGLWQRVQTSFISALDVLRILVVDAVTLSFGYGIVQLTSHVTLPGDGFFQIAEKLSHGLFLLLYVILATIHTLAFLKDQQRVNKGEK